MSTIRLEKVNIGIGAFLWLLCAWLGRPSPLSLGWPLLLVLLGAFVLVPWGRLLFERHFALPGSRLASLYQTLAAMALAVSVQLDPAGPVLQVGVQATFRGINRLNQGIAAAGMTVPWLIVCGAMFLHALKLWRTAGGSSLAARLALVGWMQLAVGGAWLFADRAGMQPMGFDGMIVRLTAAHFHFAGFLLPLMAGFLLLRPSAPWVRLCAVGAAGGVILVALGITLTKLGGHPAMESLLAAAFCLFVLGLGLGQIMTARRLGNHWLVVSGLSLCTGMAFALLYALRLWLPLPWLHLPFMWAVHGSVQVFGFAACGLIGWSRR